jgi:hypothetical protein
MRSIVVLAVAVLLPVPAFCQAMVESAILSGAAASAASGTAKATGSALSKSLGKLNSTLSGAGGAGVRSNSTSAIPVPRAGGTPPPPKPSQKAFEGIEPGTPRADLIAKAGKPQFAITSSDYEMMNYATSEGGSVRIRVVDGKVSTIEQTPPKTLHDAQTAPPAEPAQAPPAAPGK